MITTIGQAYLRLREIHISFNDINIIFKLLISIINMCYKPGLYKNSDYWVDDTLEDL